MIRGNNFTGFELRTTSCRMSTLSTSEDGENVQQPYPGTVLSSRTTEEERPSPPPQPPPLPVSVEQRLIEAYQTLMGGDPIRRHEGGQRPESITAILMNTLLSTPLYPFKLVQVLIQLGHEPVEPQRRYSFMFQQYMYYYPGLLGYTRAIVREEGWTGLYRGVGHNLYQSVVSLTARNMLQPLVYSAVNRIPMPFHGIETGDVPDTEPKNSLDNMSAILTRVSRMFLSSLFTSFAVELVVHPFQVMTIRSMAQAIGKETTYNVVWSSAVEIYQTQGLRGFYSGLVPALLGHLCTVLIHSTLMLMFEIITANITHQVGKVAVKTFIAMPLLAYIPRSYSYPFFLMSNLMVVNDMGLAAGALPYAPVYQDWRDCYRHLKSTGSLYRGSVVLFSRFAYRCPPV